MGRSRGGFGTKIHILSDANGLPLAATLSPGEQHESKRFTALMFLVGIKQQSGRQRSRPEALAGDKAYSMPWIRRWLRNHKIQAVIPLRSDQANRHKGRPLNFDPELYRERNTVERCIGWLKEARTASTRYEKLATNYLGMLHLAIIRRYFRAEAEFSDRA